MMFQPTQFSLGVGFMLATVLIAGWTDWRRWRIPNALLASSAVIAILWAALSPTGIGWVRCLLGGATGLAMFLPLYLLRGMAAGDVKLLGVLGMYAGPLMAVDIALMSALVGGMWAVALVARRRSMARQSRTRGAQQAAQSLSPSDSAEYSQDMARSPSQAVQGHAIPYGVVMAMGTLIVVAASML